MGTMQVIRAGSHTELLDCSNNSIKFIRHYTSPFTRIHRERHERDELLHLPQLMPLISINIQLYPLKLYIVKRWLYDYF